MFCFEAGGRKLLEAPTKWILQDKHRRKEDQGAPRCGVQTGTRCSPKVRSVARFKNILKPVKRQRLTDALKKQVSDWFQDFPEVLSGERKGSGNMVPNSMRFPCVFPIAFSFCVA